MNKEPQFIIFICLFALIFVISYLYRNSSYIVQARISLGIMIVLLLIYSFRTLGLDWVNYTLDYHTFSVTDFFSDFSLKKLFAAHFEPFYQLLMSLSKILGLSFAQFCLLLYMIPFVIFGGNILRAEKPLAHLFAFTLLMMYHFDLTRAIVAIAFIYAAYHTKNKIGKAVLYLFAIGFHYSSVLAMLIEIVVAFRKRKIYKPLIAAGLLALIPWRFLNLGEHKKSGFDLLEKVYYYLFRSSSLDEPVLLNISFLLINLFPILCCIWLIFKYDSFVSVSSSDPGDAGQVGAENDPRVSEQLEARQKDKHFLALCTLISLVLLAVYNTIQGSFRIVFLASFIVYSSLSNILSANWGAKTLRFKGVSSVFMFALCDLWMTSYYLLAFYYY